MRIAEKAFINLIQVKNYRWAGFTLQIFSNSFMGQKQFFVYENFELEFHIYLVIEVYEHKTKTILPINTMTQRNK